MVLIAKFLFLALTATATPILRRDATTVQNDITQKIDPHITKLNNDVNGFPASGFAGSLTIHDDFQTLATVVKATTDDIKATGSFGIVSGTSILSSVQSLTPKLTDTLDAIGSKEADWAALPDGKALMLSDLQSLQKLFSDFDNSLTAAEPFIVQPGVLVVQTEISGAFDSAIAEYSS
ncbi:hypothetical protein PEBR_33028 [Penicillium brasilianum]|uniref:Hydrophobic surface binding protein A-domain-containing protein n=1 Tax=Penicillium brasilianum TaxID=104259 RepID=A0A1S9REP0_PENBI|nr:hypothetical protein PEBR_33028 [Penicillium brasilianum]